MILFFDNKILNLNGNVSNNDPDPSVSIVKLEDNLGSVEENSATGGKDNDFTMTRREWNDPSLGSG